MKIAAFLHRVVVARSGRIARLFIVAGLLSIPFPTWGDPPPLLRIERNNDKVKMDWAGKGRVEWAPSPQGPWESVGELQSPFTMQQNRAAAFFRFRLTDGEVHDAATWVLDLLSPVDDEPKAFDETLLSFVDINVCVLESDGSCSNRVTLKSPELQLQGNFYQINWKAPSGWGGRNLRFEITVGGLEIGTFVENSFSAGTFPIKFRIEDHPRLRARVLHLQGFGANDVATVLAREFSLDAVKTAQVLLWEQYDAVAIATALRDVFHYSAGATVKLLRSLGHDVNAAMAVLRAVYGETASGAA